MVVVERKAFPREKTCGDGLTPRAIRQLEDMGLAGSLEGHHRYTGLRCCAYGRELELPWPEHPSFPSYGYVVTRFDLDGIVAENAANAGATLLQHTEATAPVLAGTEGARKLPDAAVELGTDDQDFPDGEAEKPSSGQRSATGAHLPRLEGIGVRDVATGKTSTLKGRCFIVAEGGLSRISRQLGARRERRFPLGMALRTYYSSPRHDDAFIESHLDLRDGNGNVLPGYGWIFPLGDGRVNAGVGLITTAGRWKGLNTSTMLDWFLDQISPSWGLSKATQLQEPAGGKLAMGLSVSPVCGPNVLAVGDAIGSINPFNGEGISYGYETGRIAASCVGRSLCGEGEGAIYDYAQRLDMAYRLYYKVGRSFVKLISHPRAMQLGVGVGMHWDSFMDWLLRIMANMMRPGETAPPEMLYNVLAAIGRIAPEPDI